MQAHNLITKKTNKSLNIFVFATTISKSANLSKKEIFLYKNVTSFLVKQKLFTLLLIWFANSKVTVKNSNKGIRVMSFDIKTLNSSHWHCSGVFIVNSEHISHLGLVFPLVTLNR